MNETTRTAKLALGATPDADPAAVRAAFLRQLRDQDYVPAPVAVEALAALGTLPEASTATHLPRRVEATHAQAIEIFAHHYWDLTPDERRTSWQALAEQAYGKPRLMARLEQLQAGLNITPPTANEPLAASFLNLIRELYPKPPREQSALWFQFLNAEPTAPLRKVAQTLQATQRGFVQLLGERLTTDLLRPTPPLTVRLLGSTDRAKNNQTARSGVLFLVLMVVGGLLSLLSRNEKPEPVAYQFKPPVFAPDWQFKMPPLPSRTYKSPALREISMRSGLSRLANMPGTPPQVELAARNIERKLMLRERLSYIEMDFALHAEAAQYVSNQALEYRAWFLLHTKGVQ